ALVSGPNLLAGWHRRAGRDRVAVRLNPSKIALFFHPWVAALARRRRQRWQPRSGSCMVNRRGPSDCSKGNDPSMRYASILVVLLVVAACGDSVKEPPQSIEADGQMFFA